MNENILEEGVPLMGALVKVGGDGGNGGRIDDPMDPSNPGYVTRSQNGRRNR